jgi:hypothetical protein
MSDAWGRVADRGRLVVSVRTRASLLADGLYAPAGLDYLMQLMPDNYPPIAMFAQDFRMLLTFMREMQPRNIRVHVAEGENAEELLAALEFGRGDVTLQ